jgi:YVTN family beta-propeller protein
MSSSAALAALMVGSLVAGCGGSHHAAHGQGTTSVATIAAVSPPSHTREATPPAQALVTDETQDRLLVVDLASGHIVRRIALPPDPEDVAAEASGGVVVVVSSAAAKVTLLNRDSLSPISILGGFDSPHIAEISPDGQHAYVTDDARGTLTAIDLANARVTSTVEVGAGAHHLSFSPDQGRTWVALGESARTIVTLDTGDVAHPRVTGRFDPGFAVHDLSFSPDGQRVWITASSDSRAAVFSALDHRLLFRVPVGPGPQHVAFEGRVVYLTSGYGSVIEEVDAATGRVLARARSPYGSFELDAGHGYVVSSSLLRGTLAIYTPQLRLLRVVRVAPAAREVAVSSPA